MGRGKKPISEDGENKRIEDADKKILKIVNHSKKPISKTQIANTLQCSPATVAKYVDIMVAEGKLAIEKYGNIHLVIRKPRGMRDGKDK